jgi:hypothetical protein
MTEHTPAAERWLATTNFNYIPEHMRDPVKRYICDGAPVGCFLMALFEGRSLVTTVAAADDYNRAAILSWANFVYNEMPGQSQGTPERVRDWIASGGINGRERQRESARG